MRISTFGFATALLSACAVDVVPIAKLVGDASPSDASGGPSRASCASNDDCDVAEFCARQHCSGGSGACRLREANCDATEQPVCGCDQLVYFNACLAAANGVSLASIGVCEEPRTCGGSGGLSCPAGAYCGQLLGARATHCPPDVIGKCWVLPPQCGEPPSSRRFAECSAIIGARSGLAGPEDAGLERACVDLCTAVRSGVPYVSASDCSG